jgi:Tol biopolymer transport system component
VSELLWVDRSGREVGSLGSRASHQDIRISRDGRRVAVATVEPKTGAADIWIYDRKSGIPTRFTSEPVEGARPVWSHDDLLLFFRSTGPDGPPDDFQKRSDGRGEKDLTLALAGVQQPMDVTPDGRQLVYSDGNRVTSRDIWILPLAKPAAPVPYLRTSAVEHDARVSPDGRWLAFVSSETGHAEVYVAPIDDPGARRRLSSQGGVGPRWGRNSREVIYVDMSDTFMSVELAAGPDIRPSVPRPLFSAGRLARNPGGGFGEPYYDLSPDGQTLLVNRVVEDPTVAPITVFLNWPAAIRGR